jgi:hypothetical protein
MKKLLVIHEHQVVGEHDALAEAHVEPSGDLVVKDRDSTSSTYQDGQWSGHGVGIVCAFHTSDPSCPRCHAA